MYSGNVGIFDSIPSRAVWEAMELNHGLFSQSRSLSWERAKLLPKTAGLVGFIKICTTRRSCLWPRMKLISEQSRATKCGSKIMKPYTNTVSACNLVLPSFGYRMCISPARWAGMLRTVLCAKPSALKFFIGISDWLSQSIKHSIS